MQLLYQVKTNRCQPRFSSLVSSIYFTRQTTGQMEIHAYVSPRVSSSHTSQEFKRRWTVLISQLSWSWINSEARWMLRSRRILKTTRFWFLLCLQVQQTNCSHLTLVPIRLQKIFSKSTYTTGMPNKSWNRIMRTPRMSKSTWVQQWWRNLVPSSSLPCVTTSKVTQN